MLSGAARSWAAGTNPYEVADRKQQLVRAGAPDSLVQHQDVNPCLYFISAMPLSSLHCLDSVQVANVPWALTGCSVFAASLVVLFRATPLTVQQRWTCAAVSLLFCPTYVGMLYGNPSVVTCSFVVLSIFLAIELRLVINGLLLG